MPQAKDMQAFDEGIAAASEDATRDDVKKLQERVMVNAWIERIDETREHDKEAYSQLVRDRSYAKGESSFRTHIPVIASYIDTWVSLLVAKNPDIDFKQAEAVEEVGTENARLVGKSLAIVVAGLLRKARWKAQCKPWVRAGLSTRVGWMKAMWMERTGTDPITATAIADLQDNITDVEQKIADLMAKDYDCSSEELELEQLRLAVAGLQSKSEAEVVKGMVLDPVDGADLTVSMDAPSIGCYLDSPWISQRIFMRFSEARTTFPDIDKAKLKACATYSKRPAPSKKGESAAVRENIQPEEASAYTEGASPVKGKGGFVCIEEVWDRDTNQVITLIRGLDQYARPPYAPNPATTRFYPFFAQIFTEVDGERWPQSLNERSQPLQDAFDRATNALEEHRARIKPKLGFNAAQLDEPAVKKIVDALTQELVPIHTLNPKADIRSLIVPLAYAALDPQVYDTGNIIAGFERVWGLQEALTATIQTAKTATEAELQQGGTNARQADKRDIFEDNLTDIAQYTAEIALQKLSREDAAIFAGPGVMWPEGVTIETVDRVATLHIRAGSSGKPNSRAQREAWAVLLPLIQALLEKIAMLRQSDPLEVADKLEELLNETAARSGESLDPTRFIPQVGQPVVLADPTTGQPVLAYPAAQQPGMEPQPAAGGAAPPPDIPASNGDPAAPDSAPPGGA